MARRLNAAAHCPHVRERGGARVIALQGGYDFPSDSLSPGKVMLPYPNDAPPQVLEFAPNELISLSIAVKLVFPKKLIGSWQGALDMPIRTRAALGPRSTGKKDRSARSVFNQRQCPQSWRAHRCNRNLGKRLIRTLRRVGQKIFQNLAQLGQIRLHRAPDAGAVDHRVAMDQDIAECHDRAEIGYLGRER
jgi:hypothetical protein